MFNIIIVNDKLIYWNFPVDIFKYFEESYILTFMFEAQLQKYYYDFHDVDYIYYQIVNNTEILFSDFNDTKFYWNFFKVLASDESVF